MLTAKQLYLQIAQNLPLEQVQAATSRQALKGLSKLTLFELTTLEPATSKDNRILSWLCSSKGDFYIIKKKFQNLTLWHVFANELQLMGLLENQIIASSLDYLLWPAGMVKAPKLLVFDMDSTFIEIEVIDELARRHGVGDRVSKVTEAAMRGDLDFSESLISRVACLENLSESVIGEICAELPLSQGVAQLVERATENQTKIVIVSGGFTPFVEHLKKQMNIYQVKANHLGVSDGFLTGKLEGLEGSMVDAQAKADFVNQLKAKLGLSQKETMAIGDGANDLLMMQETGFSLAYRAKPAVQKQAKGRMNQTTLNHLIKVFDW